MVRFVYEVAVYSAVHIGHDFLISRKLQYPRRCRISQLLLYYARKNVQVRSFLTQLWPLDPALLRCVYYAMGVYKSTGDKTALCIGNYMDLQQITG
jgi:hypothetical protein